MYYSIKKISNSTFEIITPYSADPLYVDRPQAILALTMLLKIRTEAQEFCDYLENLDEHSKIFVCMIKDKCLTPAQLADELIKIQTAEVKE